MAKRFSLLTMAILLLGPVPDRVPFEMRIVDGRTGIGIPNLRVTTEFGIVCHTLGGGSCYWWRSALMNRNVRFEILDDTNEFTTTSTTVSVRRGGRVVVAVHRGT